MKGLLIRKVNIVYASLSLYMISCIGKIKVKTGEELYKMSRDDLRENCGMMEGIRLFSLLQRDRKEVHTNDTIQSVADGIKDNAIYIIAGLDTLLNLGC